ncbi:transposable element Tcb2 transposase [Trichonephila clavipes]|nr:transposable element Tcb2 transposase [Trichonephila clavipes]
MSPIGHEWDIVGRRIARDLRPVASTDELWLRIQTIWNTLPQTDIKNLFNSMPRRVAALIAARADREVTSAVPTPIFSFHCKRGNKDQWPNSNPRNRDYSVYFRGGETYFTFKETPKGKPGRFKRPQDA